MTEFTEPLAMKPFWLGDWFASLSNSAFDQLLASGLPVTRETIDLFIRGSVDLAVKAAELTTTPWDDRAAFAAKVFLDTVLYEILLDWLLDLAGVPAARAPLDLPPMLQSGLDELEAAA